MSTFDIELVQVSFLARTSEEAEEIQENISAFAELNGYSVPWMMSDNPSDDQFAELVDMGYIDDPDEEEDSEDEE
jgi:hypothetical protein